MLIHANLGPDKSAVPIAFVAVGGMFDLLFGTKLNAPSAMLVGSIGWSKKAGDRIAKGEELGWFQVRSDISTIALLETTLITMACQYGGSTTICVFPSAAGVVFDEDMATNSEHKVETLVKVGMEIARVR